MKKSILEIDHIGAKEFFLTQQAFTNINLPPYFVFEGVLKKIDENIGSNILDFSVLEKAKHIDTVNHILYGNKDGKYAWRKLQIIHPLIYLSMVNIVTKQENWIFLQELFGKFQSVGNIECVSLPIIPMDEEKQAGAQIYSWLENIEKKSISLSLKYKFLYHTDITDCYGSIYTHSFSWAMHTKQVSKNKRAYGDLVGNMLDHHLQAMSNGQTNGIPQGSLLMDFIAEIVLGYADLKLCEKLKYNRIDEYHILRYRDDYRIFVNDMGIGDIIFKYLSEILLDLGFCLNTNKTCFQQDVIGGSLKEDKYGSLKYGLVPEEIPHVHELSRQLLIVQQIGKKFPNSGVLLKRLTKISEAIKELHDYETQEEILAAILTDIGYNNPRCFSRIMSLMCDCISKLSENKQMEIFEKIRGKIGTLSNIGLLEIWLQRVVFWLKLKLGGYSELLCRHAENNRIKKVFISDCFTSDWVSDRDLKNILDTSNYIDQVAIDSLGKIKEEEISPFYDD